MCSCVSFQHVAAHCDWWVPDGPSDKLNLYRKVTQDWQFFDKQPPGFWKLRKSFLPSSCCLPASESRLHISSRWPPGANWSRLMVVLLQHEKKLLCYTYFTGTRHLFCPEQHGRLVILLFCVENHNKSLSSSQPWDGNTDRSHICKTSGTWCWFCGLIKMPVINGTSFLFLSVSYFTLKFSHQCMWVSCLIRSTLNLNLWQIDSE